MPLCACHPRHASPTSCHVPCALECFDRTGVHITARLLDSRANNRTINHALCRFHFAAHHVAKRAAVFTANRADRAQLIRAAVTGIVRGNFANRTHPTPINRGAGHLALLLSSSTAFTFLFPVPLRHRRRRAELSTTARRRSSSRRHRAKLTTGTACVSCLAPPPRLR